MSFSEGCENCGAKDFTLDEKILLGNKFPIYLDIKSNKWIVGEKISGLWEKKVTDIEVVREALDRLEARLAAAEAQLDGVVKADGTRWTLGELWNAYRAAQGASYRYAGPQQDRIKRLEVVEAENLRLREALRDLHGCVIYSDCYKHLPDQIVKAARAALTELENGEPK
jgi:hypothetical protein